ncbi:MAG: GNAT family N-acetyltransferase [Pricia sp.]
MIDLNRTTFKNHDFAHLVAALDKDLAQRDGEEHSFYDQFNSIEGLHHAVVAYSKGKPVGCGAIKEFSSDSIEVKRMYVLPEFRGKGVASQLLTELEDWAAALGYTHCVLETGKRQPEAIALYKKNGYKTIVNYGQYVGVVNSVCFCKEL